MEKILGKQQDEKYEQMKKENRKLLTGIYGTGKRMDITEDQMNKSGFLTGWILNVPGAHPFWEDYVISVIHLRPVVGLPPTHKDFIGASHELMVLALQKNDKVIKGPVPGFIMLTPPNVRVQFKAAFDKGAMEVSDLMAKATLDGMPWIEPQGVIGAAEAWKNSIKMTAMHYDLPLDLSKGACPVCGSPLYKRHDGKMGCAAKACSYVEEKSAN
jgi:hypothetical protein